MIFILVYPKLGLHLVITLQDEISLIQPAIVEPITTGFQQPANSSTGLHS